VIVPLTAASTAASGEEALMVLLEAKRVPPLG